MKRKITFINYTLRAKMRSNWTEKKENRLKGSWNDNIIK